MAGLQPGDLVLDFSGMRMDAAKIKAAKAAGAKAVMRYSAGVGNSQPATQWKLITPAEFRQLDDAGFDILANSEWYESRVTEGASAGAADGAADLKLWRSCGLAKGATIYCSWDAYPSRLKYGAVRRYLNAYRKALGGYYEVDLYAGSPALKWLRRKGAIRFGWRPNAGSWSNDGLPYQPDTSTPAKRAALVTWALKATTAHLWQTGSYWFGRSADENLVVRAPVGSHREALAARRPKPPKPAPIEPTPEPVEEAGHYHRGERSLDSPSGEYALFMQDDGRVEVRYAGRHRRYLRTRKGGTHADSGGNQ